MSAETRRLTRAAALLAGLALLAACDNATSGRVTGLEHVREHDELVGFICGAYDAKGGCVVQVPNWQHVDECWRIDFHNDGDDEDGAVCTSEQEFGTYRVGDHFPRPR